MTIDKNQNIGGNTRPQLLPSRPELGISSDIHANTQATGDRILSNLKYEAIAKQPSIGLTGHPGVKFLSLLGISAIATFAGYQFISNAADSNTPSGAQDHSVVTPAPAVLAAAMPVASAPEVAPTVVAEAAQIVAMPSPLTTTSTANLPTPAQDALTKSLEDGVAPADAAIQKALEAKAPNKTQARVKVASKRPATRNPSVTVNPVASAATKASPVSTKKSTPSTDQDVNLLAALIAHSEAIPARSKAVPAKTKVSTAEAKRLEEKIAAREKEDAEKK